LPLFDFALAAFAAAEDLPAEDFAAEDLTREDFRLMGFRATMDGGGSGSLKYILQPGESRLRFLTMQAVTRLTSGISAPQTRKASSVQAACSSGEYAWPAVGSNVNESMVASIKPNCKTLDRTASIKPP
jgi:hypothetical protein